LYAINHQKVPYHYYYNIFHNEFASTLGFDLPKTNCCNECESYKTKRTTAMQQNNIAEVTCLELQHKQHLEIADLH
jgi:hypothetical protein